MNITEKILIAIAVVLALPLLAVNSVMANVIIKNPTSRDCLQYAIYRESRGESLVTMRAVADVVLNRGKAKKLSICETILAKGQFPYASKGIKKVSDKKFLTKYFKVITMKPVVSSDVLFFNSKKHKWGRDCSKKGGLVFCK